MLVDGVQEAGMHTVTFQADGLPSGVYFYQLEVGTHRLVRRMVLLR